MDSRVLSLHFVHYLFLLFSLAGGRWQMAMGCLWSLPAVMLYHGRLSLQRPSDPLCFLSPYTLGMRSHHLS